MKIGKYKHYKGNFYQVVGIATHSETLEELVVYHPLESEILWVRPRAMFEETITIEGNLVKRFSYIEESNN